MTDESSFVESQQSVGSTGERRVRCDGGANGGEGGGKEKEDILVEQIREGVDELERPTSGLFLSGLSAGLDIGFGPLFMAVVLTLVGGHWGEPATRIAVAAAYTIGFIFVVLGRTELFTEHTTMAVLPVLDGRASLRQLGRLWGIVYVANIVGGTVFGAAAVYLAPRYGIVDLGAFVTIAEPLLGHGPGVLLMAGVLAGWLMGLLSWLVTAAEETLAEVCFVFLVTLAIGLGHLPHSIAGSVEVFTAMLVSPTIGLLDYLRFVVLATVGNAVGGSVFVALLKYGHIVRSGK